MNLRQYAETRRIVIVSFIAAWCRNSNRNGHVAKRIYDKYKSRGLGMVAVTEYSSPEEVRIYVNRFGSDYPVVSETVKRSDRKKSVHHKYRSLAGDKRKWGTPFYMIIDTARIDPPAGNGLLTQRLWVVAGEIVETEVDRFLEERLDP